MDTVTCPRCGTGSFDPARTAHGYAVCGSCGHRAATAYLAEQLWLEQQETLLQTRLGWVREQVRAGAAPQAATLPPAGAVPHPPTGAPLPPGTPFPAGPTDATSRATGSPGVQSLLLATGGLLLVAAAAVFVAVTWDLLGPAGQLTSLAVATAVLSGGAHAARTRFRGTAETLAAVAAAMTVIALLAAPALGLVTGWWRDHGAAWAALAFGLTTVLGITLTAVSGLITWRVTTVAGFLAGAQSAVVAMGGGADVPVGGPVVLAIAAAAVLRLRPGRSTRFGRDAVRLGSGLGVLAALDALAGYAHLDRAGSWSLAWAVLAGCGWIVAIGPAPGTPLGPGDPHPPTPRATPRIDAGTVGAVVLTVALGQALVLAVRALAMDPSLGLPLLAAGGAGLLATTLLPHRVLPGAAGAGWAGAGWAGAGWAGAVAVWVTALPVLVGPGDITGDDLAGYFGIIAVATHAVSLLPRRGPAALPAALCTVATVRALDLDPSAGLPVLAVIGAGLLATTLIHRLVLPGLLGAATVWGLALPVTVSGNGFGHHDLAAFLTVVAATGYAMALVPRRGFTAWPAAVCASAAAWTELAAADVTNLEAFTGSSALLLLPAGLLQRRDRPHLGPSAVMGPALMMAFLPSAIDAFSAAARQAGGPLRGVLVILAGSALAASGAMLRVRVAFLLGLVAALLAGLGQVFAVAEVLPRWVALALGGAMMIGTGFGAEAVRTAGRRFRVFTGRMR